MAFIKSAPSIKSVTSVVLPFRARFPFPSRKTGCRERRDSSNDHSSASQQETTQGQWHPWKFPGFHDAQPYRDPLNPCNWIIFPMGIRLVLSRLDSVPFVISLSLSPL